MCNLASALPSQGHSVSHIFTICATHCQEKLTVLGCVGFTFLNHCDPGNEDSGRSQDASCSLTQLSVYSPPLSCPHFATVMFSASKIGKLKTQLEVIAFSSTQKVLGLCHTAFEADRFALSSYVSALTPKVSAIVLLLSPLLTSAVEVVLEKSLCVFHVPTPAPCVLGSSYFHSIPFHSLCLGAEAPVCRTASAAGLC